MKNIIVAVDSGSHSLLAAKYAICLSMRLEAKLTVIHVINEKILQDLLKRKVLTVDEAEDYRSNIEQESRSLIDRIKKMAESKGVEPEGLILRGVVCEEIIDKIEEMSADLLVMGELKEVTSMKSIFYDEGENLLRNVPCPVLVVKNVQLVETLFKNY